MPTMTETPYVHRKLTTLPGFKMVGERVYTGPGHRRLMLRIVEADGITEAELRFADQLHRSKVSTLDDALDTLIPCCCEECGGTRFVQKILFKNRRIIEVLECASGLEISDTADRIKICTMVHPINGDRVSGLTPSPELIALASKMVARQSMRDRDNELNDQAGWEDAWPDFDNTDPQEDDDGEFYERQKGRG